MRHMSDQKEIKLSPVQEGLVGAIFGLVVGGVLVYAKVISLPAVVGIAAGVGLGSWFNAWRRSRK